MCLTQSWTALGLYKNGFTEGLSNRFTESLLGYHHNRPVELLIEPIFFKDKFYSLASVNELNYGWKIVLKGLCQFFLAHLL